jgi:hypothetical protein
MYISNEKSFKPLGKVRSVGSTRSPKIIGSGWFVGTHLKLVGTTRGEWFWRDGPQGGMTDIEDDEKPKHELSVICKFISVLSPY